MLIEWIVGVLYAVLSMFGKVVYMIVIVFVWLCFTILFFGVYVLLCG